MEIKGKVKLVTVEQNISASYTKRELVVVTEEQYPQSIMIEFPQGKCNNELDKLSIGELVVVGINIGGREWVNPQGETKYFNSIKGWKITKENNAPTPPAPSQPQVHNAVPIQENNQEEEGDLPF